MILKPHAAPRRLSTPAVALTEPAKGRSEGALTEDGEAIIRAGLIALAGEGGTEIPDDAEISFTKRVTDAGTVYDVSASWMERGE